MYHIFDHTNKIWKYNYYVVKCTPHSSMGFQSSWFENSLQSCSFFCCHSSSQIYFHHNYNNFSIYENKISNNSFNSFHSTVALSVLFSLPFYPYWRTFFHCSLEGEKWRERNINASEKHWLVASHMHPDWGLNLLPFGYGTWHSSQLSHTEKGTSQYSFQKMFSV